MPFVSLAATQRCPSQSAGISVYTGNPVPDLSVVMQMCPALSTDRGQTRNKDMLLITTQQAALIHRRHLSSNLLGTSAPSSMTGRGKNPWGR